MSSRFSTLFPLAFVALVACEDHFNTQDAYAVCDTLTERNPQISPPSTFLDCVGCYETCGNECQQTTDPTLGFLCPDEVGAEGGAPGEGGAGGAE